MTTPEEKAKVNSLYGIICDRKFDHSDPKLVQDRVEIIRQMEGIMKASFLNTKDFHAKTRLFLGI